MLSIPQRNKHTGPLAIQKEVLYETTVLKNAVTALAGGYDNRTGLGYVN